MLVAERVGLAIAVQGLEGLTRDRGCYSPVFKRSGDGDCMTWPRYCRSGLRRPDER